MSYILNSTSIRRPANFNESNTTQVAQNRTLSGSYTRDYFGSNKRIWTLSYNNCNVSDFSIINTIYTNYLATGTAVSWSTDEANYTVSATTVHVDLVQRSFSVKGSDYLSDFDLILTEA